MSVWECLFFSLSPACSLSVPVNLLGRLPWLLIGSGSCHSSLSDMTPTYPLPVKFPLADKRTLKGVNGDLSFALCICCHFTHFWLPLFVIRLCQNPLCFVLTFLILITFWFAILLVNLLLCYSDGVALWSLMSLRSMTFTLYQEEGG